MVTWRFLSVSNEQVQTAANNLKYDSAVPAIARGGQVLPAGVCLSRGPLTVVRQSLSLADRDLTSSAKLAGYM